jgi:hypothetical protein
MMGFDFKNPEIPECTRKPLLRPSDAPMFAESVTPTRFVLPLPSAAKGPIRAEAYRKTKDRNANALDPKGTPHQASAFSPRRD